MKVKVLPALVFTTCSMSLLPLSTLAKDVEMDGSVGIGYDSNIYRTPDKVYFDYFSGTPPVQNLQSGLFIPLDYSLDYRKDKKNTDNFYLDYDFGGDFYLDGQFSNANSWDQELGIGRYFMQREVNKLDRGAEARVFLHQAFKRYVDRDTGTNKISSVSGEDISEKYSYISLGAEVSYEWEASKEWDFEVGAMLENFDYKTPPAPTSSEYDYDHTEFFAGAAFSPYKNTKFKAGLNQYTDSYKDREARDLTGSTAGPRPLLEYAYTDVDLVWRQRFSKKLVTYIGYKISDRKDLDVGYYDRTKNTVSVRALYDISPKLETKVKLSLSDSDYPNALAFDTPASGLRKTYSSTYFKWELDYELRKDLFIETDIRFYDTDSTDTRYDYERNVIAVAVSRKW